jgi:hypothetical protein
MWKRNLIKISTLTLLFLVQCKSKESQIWNESELESLGQQVNFDAAPPQPVLARLMASEHNLALKVFDRWAAEVLKSQKNDPQSPLNKVRRIFNPDHMKNMSIEMAEATLRSEGSGTHGSLAREKKPQDVLYHALWSRIADAAGLLQHPRSSRHMKHFLGNSGRALRYSEAESITILNSTETTQPVSDAVGLQLEKEFLKGSMAKKGWDMAESEADMIAGMSRDERAFYVARLRLRASLARHIQSSGSHDSKNAEQALNHLENPKTAVSDVNAADAWKRRPSAKVYRLVSSKPQSDMYFAMGSYTVIHSVSPIEVRAYGEQLGIRFVQFRSLYDRYNWDDGKFITLLADWCWNLRSSHCSNLEELTAVQVSDRSLGRLHKLGLAREFEIFGKTKQTTVWDKVKFDDLSNPKKAAYWNALATELTQDLMKMTLPDL